MEKDIVLESRLVGTIKGDFFVPSYQRGYRWGKTEVVRLLDDIYSCDGDSYYLQPVVVRKNGDKYELIDGQQRLTTIYLVYRYMNNASGGFIDEPQFSLYYETRKKSASFLQSVDMARKEENIDFWFICNAYDSIKQWFEAKEKKSVLTNINKYFDEKVKIIWYEVNDSDDAAISLFARLNIGKIPLTSAELVKAMFFSRDTKLGIDKNMQKEIALQWDNIEKELHENDFWYFLTNQSIASYQTRIDLVLDLIAGKKKNSRENYYTFFKFDEMRQKKPVREIWHKIQKTFLLLKDWFENHELYHKIGYIIASKELTLSEVYNLSLNKTKAEFIAALDASIRNSMEGVHSELTYENAADQKKIKKLLLLFNVESVRQNGEHSQWFPFDKFKFSNDGRVAWSLEHIHAQQSEGLKDKKAWKEWLRLHIPSVEAVDRKQESLIEEMKSAFSKSNLQRKDFEKIQQKVVQVLSVKGNTEYIHSISNLSLLRASDNAALNNSAFDVKRNVIIKMDIEGQYIPFCTRMVFLKYYTPSAGNQLHFWGESDRKAYIDAINRVLGKYLPEKIV
ncbi:MAG: DUF262 domain-containing protein [Selenomonadaceae bacterium]|nr:DUF262 domain-containing protein [Selenomonadaceae bacterium]